MKKWLIVLGVAAALIAALSVLAQDSAGGRDVGSQYEGTIAAPEFPAGLDWLNVPAPLTLDGLRGKIVVLDFWTYGCINCIHMIPVLKQIEEKYGDTVVVIGVHSAKFAKEGETDNIRQIVQRYGLEHPVINDSQFLVWQTYSVQAWPTFAVIDPRGSLLAMQAGEVPFEAFDRLLNGMVEHFDTLGELKREPLELTLESAAQPNTALSFPGKVLADAAGGRLFIADTNHHRIVIADLNTYEVLDVIGSGARGFSSGGFAEAAFNKPQGMALDGSTLYVADTENHAIRAVDLSGRTVRTLAGTGQQARLRNESGPADQVALASPWDVEIADGVLYIAMAGPHQLWSLTLSDNFIAPLVGSGREGLLDGLFQDAQLAQPSGLFYSGGMLYFADSESSSIRVADINGREVHTLAGPGENNLFDFGDEDGRVGQSRLQHALGITGSEDGLLYIADTYNNKIKVLNPVEKTITSLFGFSENNGGLRDGGPEVAEFDEPGGLDYASGRLYVADTNNHAVRVIDLAAKTVTTIAFPNPEMLQIGDRPTVVGGNSAQGMHINLPEQIAAAGAGEIVLNIILPEGYKLNSLAPFTSEWTSSGEAVIIDEVNRIQRIPAPELPIRVPIRLNEGEDLLHGDLTIYYCEAVNETLCFVDRVSIDAPVVVAPGGASTIMIERSVPLPRLPESQGI